MAQLGPTPKTVTKLSVHRLAGAWVIGLVLLHCGCTGSASETMLKFSVKLYAFWQRMTGAADGVWIRAGQLPWPWY